MEWVLVQYNTSHVTSSYKYSIIVIDDKLVLCCVNSSWFLCVWIKSSGAQMESCSENGVSSILSVNCIDIAASIVEGWLIWLDNWTHCFGFPG